jgi:hypothetical protein
MAINGSELIDQPWNTTFSPFTNLFDSFLDGAGVLFFLVPITIIAVALYVKTREPVMVSMYLIASGALFAGSGLFIGSVSMQLVYVVVAAIGFVSLFISLFFKR